ncbi:hypothetical protein [Chitinilyticum litopenaei]|uniref:hypothetical protein n=1 Tax=Chitinilyticum litopenaei TaxID=1121276 RepID=UPI0003FE1E18|nr:hypothetical protein [Chitinilyticum litopenaei]
MALSIAIQRVDGDVGRYAIPDPAQARQWLAGLDPRRLFARPNLVIADAHCVSLIATSTIAWLTLHATQGEEAYWQGGQQQAYMTACTALFGRSAYLAELETARLRWQQGEPEYGEYEALGELLFRDGLEYYVQVSGKHLAAAEQQMLLNNFFEFPVFRANDPAGGYTLLNPETLTRARFYTSRATQGLPPHTIHASAIESDHGSIF